MTQQNEPGTETSLPELTMTRTFDAPRDLVWKAFTESDRLVQWWGPKGFKMLVSKSDFRQGGMFHYGMQSPDGNTMWGKLVYGEIKPQERITFTSSFSDENGGTTRHPISTTWPLEIMNIWTLKEQDGKTTLEMKATPLNASGEELKTFEGASKSVQQGTKGMLDQLEEYLASVK